MKKRSRFTVVTKLIGLVKPLTAYMALAVIMGIVGHLCASFITIFGGFAVLDLVGVNVPFSLTIIFISGDILGPSCGASLCRAGVQSFYRI